MRARRRAGVKCSARGRTTNRGIRPTPAGASLRFAGERPSNTFWSISKKLLESLRRQGGIARRILYVAMPHVGLDRPRVVTIVGELVAAGMTEHVSVGLDFQVGSGG
jgi:hypothetical protein